MNDIAEQVISLTEKYIGDGNFKIKNGQIIAKVCPFCNGGDSGKDFETFAIGLHNGAWNCMRGKCKKSGSLKELAEHFGVESYEINNIPKFVKESKIVYGLPNESKYSPITEKIEMYFALRRIGKDTLNDFKIMSDKDGDIVFPFYENNILTYVKFRIPERYTKDSEKPKEWQLPNTKQILFGMNNTSYNKPLVITEGQIDAMSVYESGYHNVVSVPTGCKNLNWIENCWDYLENFQQFILFGDNDEPGVAMIDTIMKRLGEDRCLLMPEYPRLIKNGEDGGRLCKDANEILVCYGSDFLYQFVNKAEQAPIKGIINLARVQFVDPSKIKRIYTRIPDLDRAIGGLTEGGVTVFSGKRGEGE